MKSRKSPILGENRDDAVRAERMNSFPYTPSVRQGSALLHFFRKKKRNAELFAKLGAQSRVKI
jgi:hypothetical protein